MELIKLEHDGCIDHINPYQINYIAHYGDFRHSTIFFGNGYSLDIPHDQAVELVKYIKDVNSKEKDNIRKNVINALVKAGIPNKKIREVLANLKL